MKEDMQQADPADRRAERLAAPEHRESLWLIVMGPTLWALHFILSYATAAVWCAKIAGRSGMLDGARIAVGVYTLVALIGIGLTAWRGYRQFSLGQATVPHDFDTAADRHRFLGFATFLLCGLSIVATLYVGLAALLIRSCA